MHHPGERFSYSLSTDVLGAVVEVVSGKSLEEFFRTRIFAPLKMNDTSFSLPAEKKARLAPVYNQANGAGIKRMGTDPNVTGYLTYTATYPTQSPRQFFSGGAGLVSTASDYGRFLQMMLNGGELDGARVLGRKTVELMTVNHVGDLLVRRASGSASAL